MRSDQPWSESAQTLQYWASGAHGKVRFVPEGREVDVALAEFSALRDEILTFHQGMAGAIAAAITATAALGAIALNPTGGRLELLLVLPFALAGLGMLHMDLRRRIHKIGKYIQEELWADDGPLDRGTSGVLPSWEAYNKRKMRAPPSLIASAIPVAVIFFIPSIASLAVAFVELAFGTWSKSLWALFGGGCVIVCIYGAITAWVIKLRFS